MADGRDLIREPLGRRVVARAFGGRVVPSEIMSAAGPSPARRPMSRPRRFFVAWGPVVLWLVVIALFSSDAGSRSSSEGGPAEFFRQWFPGAVEAVRDSNWAHTIIVVVRKLAHLVEYGVLGLLGARAFHLTSVAGSVDVVRGGAAASGAARTVARALILSGLVAALDELNQLTIPTRTGSAVDVLIDLAGAAIGIMLWFRLRRTESRSGPPRAWPGERPAGGPAIRRTQ